MTWISLLVQFDFFARLEVVVDNHFWLPPISVRRILTGASQFTWMCAIDDDRRTASGATYSGSPGTWLMPVADTARAGMST